MKHYIVGLTLLFSSALCFGQSDQQAIKDDFVPSSLNQPGQTLPAGELARIRAI